MRKSPIPQASLMNCWRSLSEKHSFVFDIRRMVTGGEKHRVLWSRQFNVAKLRKETRKCVSCLRNDLRQFKKISKKWSVFSQICSPCSLAGIVAVVYTWCVVTGTSCLLYWFWCWQKMAARLKNLREQEVPLLTAEIVALVVAVAVGRQLHHHHHRQLEQVRHQGARRSQFRCAEESAITWHRCLMS